MDMALRYSVVMLYMARSTQKGVNRVIVWMTSPKVVLIGCRQHRVL